MALLPYNTSIGDCKSRNKKSDTFPFVFDSAVRLYSTAGLPDTVPISKAAQLEQLMSKAAELSLQASKLNDSGDYASAESLLEGALSLRAKALEGYAKEAGSPTPPDYTVVTARLEAALAFSKTSQQKFSEALVLYTKCLPVLESFLSDERDRGVILMNYSEALLGDNKPYDAIESGKQALAILKRHDVHAEDELKAVALANLGGYYCAVKKYSEAKPHAGQALKIFLNKLGRGARMTKDAWNNYYCILSELGQVEEAKDLETEWRTAHEGVASKQAQKLNDKQVEDIRRRLEERVFAPKRAEPAGAIKDPAYHREEIASFAQNFRESGFDLEDPAHLSSLQKELNALKRGEKHSSHVMARETERIANIASQHGESWESLLKELDDIQEQTAAVDASLADERISAHKARAEDIASRPKKSAAPSKELLAEIEALKIKKAENARKKAEAEKAAAEAAAKAAAEAAAKKGKGKKR